MERTKGNDKAKAVLARLEEIFGQSRVCSESYSRFRKEAEEAGMTEVAAFIGEAISHHKDLAQRARLLITGLEETRKGPSEREDEEAPPSVH